MKRTIIVLGLAMTCVLGGCSASQQSSAVAAGQLFCAEATTNGPLVVALADAAGAPVIATGLAQQVVINDCAAISAIPVSPPSTPAPTVAAVLPPAS